MSRYEKAAQLKSPHPVQFWKRHSYRDSKEVAGCQGFMGRGNQAEHGGFRAAGGLRADAVDASQATGALPGPPCKHSDHETHSATCTEQRRERRPILRLDLTCAQSRGWSANGVDTLGGAKRKQRCMGRWGGGGSPGPRPNSICILLFSSKACF